MCRVRPICLLLVLLCALPCSAATVSGELKQWHTVTLTFEGPMTSETAEPNPFLFYRLDVVFRHTASGRTFLVPGYYAADGGAGQTSADSGSSWRTHFCPDETGCWEYIASFRKGEDIAVSEELGAGTSAGFCDGHWGSFQVADTDKQWPDFRARGRLEYVGRRYLRCAGSGEYFLKAGADSPETLLAFEDFDGTYTLKTPLKAFRSHVADWRPGDPQWKNGRGRGLIGALNFLASAGMNSVSFLTYNNGGDGANVWPFVRHDTKTRYDCSKLDQWLTVFEHAQAKGLHLTVKTQETEIDNDVPESLDGGELGRERRLYYRELIARFGHLPAMTWNLGEENSQTREQQKAMARHFALHDVYRHNVALHTFPHQIDEVYRPLLGFRSRLTSASMQCMVNQVHEFTIWWMWESRQAGKPWVVCSDEQGGADTGVPPDTGYGGYEPGGAGASVDDVRREVLWGNLMAGGAGVEYYFGYSLPCHDLDCEDWRSRAQSWEYARLALDFFRRQAIPVQDLFSNDRLTPEKDDYCFSKDGVLYLVYLKHGGTVELELPEGAYSSGWFNPRTGEGMDSPLQPREVTGPARESFAAPDALDWLLVVRRK